MHAASAHAAIRLVASVVRINAIKNEIIHYVSPGTSGDAYTDALVRHVSGEVAMVIMNQVIAYVGERGGTIDVYADAAETRRSSIKLIAGDLHLALEVGMAYQVVTGE